MQAAANDFVAFDGRGPRQRRTINDFFVRPAHGDKKSLIPTFGKRPFAEFPERPSPRTCFLLKQGLQKFTRADSFPVLLKNLCQ
jgi:hypothetical protein